MCGIAGIVFEKDKPSLSRLRSMQKAIEFRGPDARKIEFHNGVALIHTRLSIIDINDRSNQPMSTVDGRFVVVYNGELYGYLSLKNELVESGCEFFTESDTEVILHGYRIWGLEKMLSKLDGMFAFALWDNLERKLVLARDRMGEKPIFYSQDNNEFKFSSSLQALVNSSSKSPEIDKTIMWSYLQKGYVGPGQSIFHGVDELKPGHFGVFADGKLKIGKYWEYKIKGQYSEITKSGSYIEAFDNILKTIIEDEVVADVPVGALLSGGVDSTLVCYYANRIRDITAFTVKMPYGIDESCIARNTAKTLGIRHEIVEASFPDTEQIARILQSFSNPLGDSSALGMYIISKAASDKVKVLLTGDGGDEFFAGYETVRLHSEVDKYRRFFNNSFFRSLADGMSNSSFVYKNNKLRKLKTFLQMVSRSPLNYHVNASHIPGYFKSRIRNYANKEGGLEALMEYDVVDTLPGDYTSKVDITTMTNSVEARSPFLHRNVVEFSSMLTTEIKRLNGTSKGFLKELLRQKLPVERYNEIAKGKRGFVVPVDQLLGLDSQETKQIIYKSELVKQGILDKNLVNYVLSINKKDAGIISRLRYSLFSLCIWYQQF